MLQVAQLAVSIGAGSTQARGQQVQAIGVFQQGDIAQVISQFWVLVGMGQNQKLHHEFGVNHAPQAVLEVKLIGP